MIRPLVRATNVSRTMTWTDSPVSEWSLSMYEPKMVMEPIPMERVKKAWLMAAKTTSNNPASWMWLRLGFR